MPVSSEFQDEIFVVKVVGEYTYDEYVDAVVCGFSDPRFTSATPVLVDSRESEASPSSEDVRVVGRRILGQRPSGHAGKWAAVTNPEPLRFGSARMGGLTMRSLGLEVQVFTDVDAALAYLRRA
jgi:hypothetical protein